MLLELARPLTGNDDAIGMVIIAADEDDGLDEDEAADDMSLAPKSNPNRSLGVSLCTSLRCRLSFCRYWQA